MCGIAGILCPPSGELPGERDLESEFRRLVVTLRHRGPDSEGVHAIRGSGLAHTRLAILDLTPAGAVVPSNVQGQGLDRLAIGQIV